MTNSQFIPPFLKNKKILIVAAVLVAVLAFILVKRSQGSSKSMVKRGPIVESVYGLGTVKSNRVFEYKVGVVTQIRRLEVKEGQQVKKDQALLTLEPGISIRAPFSGTITSLPFHENENIFPQVVALRLEDLSDRLIEINLEQQAALRVKPGQSALLSFESLRGEKYKSKVLTIYPSQGQFLVRLDPESLPAEILPGMTVDVAIEIQKKENASLIPALAVQNGKAIIHRNGKSEKLDLKIGISDGEWVEVLEPLLEDGAEVTVPKGK